MKSLKSVTLEMSLKPFRETGEEYIRWVCRDVFAQWKPLLKGRDQVSVMLWTADGSEILDYAGRMEEPFEWGYFLGTANLPLAGEGDRPDLSLHTKARHYMEDPPVMTYGILRDIVRILKEEGSSALPGVKIRVGETFDIGPEFALSSFKYTRHTEIISGAGVDRKGFIDSTARLHADDRVYAAYPDGIPEGEPFGLFLGRQADVFLRDMGFDYLWLSNGMGFSSEPWKMTGKIFDGERFYPEKLERVRGDVFEFWKYFRQGCPDYPLETRGTNNSVGIDYATDGVPLYDIYHGGFDILPPPNSPWAALNDNFGLELMGHMTRICDLPGGSFLFRFYIHDPWWVNSPWTERYDSAPHDIYLPMAISRLDEAGKVCTADHLNLLSIDNSYGEMPDLFVNEPLPHLLKAEEHVPDAPGPLVWVYPMHEYTTATREEVLAEMYFGDRFVCDSINDGLMLNSVVSTDSFLVHDLSIYKDCVLISPLPERPEVGEKLASFASSGGRVIFYGSAARKKLAPAGDGIEFLQVGGEALLRAALNRSGWQVKFTKKVSAAKVPTMTLHKHDNALFLSVYNTNTTTETMMKFPLGAPVLMGCETELRDGFATYHFARAEHRECRVFVEQKEGVIGARERTVVNDDYRRRFAITGLQDATLRYFPETDAMGAARYSDYATGGDTTPEYLSDWTWVAEGGYYEIRHVTGDLNFYTPKKR